MQFRSVKIVSYYYMNLITVVIRMKILSYSIQIVLNNNVYL